jgi:predicted permease
MGLLQKIQNQPQTAKIRIMWAVSVIVVILLIAVWIISARLHKNSPKDTSLFQTIGQGIHNVKNNFRK